MKKTIWFALLILSFPAEAQFEAETELPTISVDGGGGPQGTEVKTVIDSKRVEQSQQLDMNRVLREAPGVYVQEEDAYGLRPNIGLRGVYPHRSKKITFLEDGLLIGPAPYAAPAAYYTPSRSRIESMEVLRGLSALPYGPNTVGGTVNDISKEIPGGSLNEFRLQGGSAEFSRLGTSLARHHGDFSWLLVLDRSESGGFKKLDTGGPTGFLKNDVMSKLRWNLPRGQSLEAKLGYSDEVSYETYLGLTEADFALTPDRRYAASDEDRMKWRHQQAELTYRRPNPDGESSVSVYSRWFWRDWRRFNQFAGSVRVQDVLRDPESGVNAGYLDVLRGNADSDSIGGGAANLIIANNERAYRSQGLLLAHHQDFQGSSMWRHRWDVGVLLHQDEINRRHVNDELEMRNGRPAVSAEPSVVADLNQDKATAQTLRTQWQSRNDHWTWSAAGRAEKIQYQMRDDLAETNEGLSESVFVPGAGVAYRFTDHWETFLNASEGVTLRGPDPDSRQERSLTLESGLRKSGELNIDLTIFETKYDQLKGVCSFSSGCTDSTLLDQSFDGGSAQVRGVEGQFQWTYSTGSWDFRPRINATLIEAKFTESFSSDENSEWGDGEINPGDPLPYVPRLQGLFGFEIEKGPFRQDWIFAWQSEMPDQSVATNRRFIESFGVIDVMTNYEWKKSIHLFLRVDNLLDNKYIVSYRPFGVRPGKDQSAILGLTAQF